MSRTYQKLETQQYLEPFKKQAKARAKSRPRKSSGDMNLVFFGAFLVLALLMAADQIPPFYDWPFIRLFF